MPAGTPANIVNAFAAACEKAIADPEFQEKCAAASIPLKYLGPKEYLVVLQQNHKNFQRLWDTNPWIQPKK
jgi:tripartite-type tricarboxylate transporter receptor subunit TctC